MPDKAQALLHIGATFSPHPESMFENILKQMGGLASSGSQYAQARQNVQYDQVDAHQAADYIGQFSQHATPEQRQQVFEEYVRSLSPVQRQALVQHPGVPVQSVQSVKANDDQGLAQVLGTLARMATLAHSAQNIS
jgi:ABC-type transporter MlaC component